MGWVKYIGKSTLFRGRCFTANKMANIMFCFVGLGCVHNFVRCEFTEVRPVVLRDVRLQMRAASCSW
jgi:hypothetical protein